MSKTRVTESLLIDLESETWHCRRCEAQLTTAEESYKRGCLVRERNPEEVHKPEIDGEYTFAPDPEWCRIVEFYCPDCGLMLENEYLPPGHPITHDIDVDIASLKEQVGGADP